MLRALLWPHQANRFGGYTSVAHQSLRAVPEIVQGHKATYNQVSKRPPRKTWAFLCVSGFGWGNTAALDVFGGIVG